MQRSSGSHGFVPIEVLAIVAVVFLLMAIALPAASKLKSRSGSFRCSVNHKQIAHAWQLYAHDNGGRSANNFILPDTEAAIVTGRFDTWANNIMTWGASGGSTADRSVTNLAWAAKGLLHPYTSGDVWLYKCPSDVFISAVQRQRGHQKRVRSVSMNAMIGRVSNVADSNSGRSWGFGGVYRQWLKARDIPDPAMTFLTLDEHPDSINDGFFISDPNAPTWGDIPATLHSGATTFSFADGHAETRKWRSATSRYPVRFVYPQPRTFDAAGRQDFAWYVSRMGLVRY
jgi:prepilin-type processing-associated H-X9-DG protein